jgi:predicted permease
MSVALALLPDLALIGIGGLAGRWLGRDAWPKIDALNYLLLFPSLLFVSAAARPIPPAEIASTGLIVWSLIVLGAGLAWPLRRWGPRSEVDFAAAWQTAWRTNTALALAAASALPAQAGALMPVAVGLAVPLSNAFAVAALSRGRGLRAGIRAVALNPLLLAALAGVAVGLSGLHLPEIPHAALQRMGEAAIPLALLSVGATIDWRAPLRLTRFTGGIVAVKLLALPAAAVLASPLLSPAQATLAVAYAALPTATASHILAAGFGADRTAAASVVAQSTLLACVTLPLWLAVAVP